MSDEVTAAILGAVAAAILGLAAFGLERILSQHRERLESQRSEFDHISSIATRYTLDVIAGKSVDPFDSGLLLAPGDRLRLKFHGFEEIAFWVDMTLDRMVLLGEAKPKNSDEERARAENLEATLRFLTVTLTNLHHGTYDEKDATQTFIGLIYEVEDRDRKFEPNEIPWWAREVPSWVTPPEPITRARAFRQRLMRKIRRLITSRARTQKAMESLVAAQEKLVAAQEESQQAREAVEKAKRNYETTLLDALIEAERLGTVDELLGSVPPEARALLEPLAMIEGQAKSAGHNRLSGDGDPETPGAQSG